MNSTKPTSWRQLLLGLLALALLAAAGGGALYGLSRVLTGTMGGAVAGGVVALLVAVVSKAFEFEKNREASIGEKRRDVYRRLLTPWEKLLVATKSAKHGEDLLATVDLSAVYASSFDAVLYGSEAVVQRYVEFRSPNPDRDALDTLRALAALLIAMREDVTGKKVALSEEAVLRTFVNFSPEELMLLRVREHVAKSPEAQKRLQEILAGQDVQQQSKSKA